MLAEAAGAEAATPALHPPPSPLLLVEVRDAIAASRRPPVGSGRTPDPSRVLDPDVTWTKCRQPQAAQIPSGSPRPPRAARTSAAAAADGGDGAIGLYRGFVDFNTHVGVVIVVLLSIALPLVLLLASMVAHELSHFAVALTLGVPVAQVGLGHESARSVA